MVSQTTHLGASGEERQHEYLRHKEANDIFAFPLCSANMRTYSTFISLLLILFVEKIEVSYTTDVESKL